MRHTRHLRAAKSYRANKIVASHITVLLLLLCLAGLTACGAGARSASAVSPSTGPTGGLLKISVPAAQATVGTAYNAVPSVSGGSAPFLFSIVDGSLPPGLVLNPSTGSITGTPSVAGTYSFTLYASTVPGKESGVTGSTPANIVVSARASGARLWISPTSPTIASQGLEQFTAQITGSSNTGVTWSATGGTISSTGAFVAPKVTSNTPITITVTSTANPSVLATVTITVTPVAALAIASSTLPEANIGTPYGATLSATGGVIPYQWSLTSGSLPSGILLQASSGAISGQTALAGSYPFTAKVTDSSGQNVSLAFTLTVSSSSASGFDGPAELPRVYIQTAMASTPAPGVTTTVNAGGDLQTALNGANCGDTIQLQAGATFTGVFNFPAKSCDDDHWIIVRTASPDSALPPEGTRLTPCYAGVSSLPGRPAFTCTSTQNVLAKLLMNKGGNSGPVVFVTGANHYRLLGLEITRTAGTGIVYALASAPAPNTANNIILDRVWLHGSAQDETKKGFELGGMSYASAIDSFFTDMHCTSISGACTDAAAVGCGSGDPVGPFKIVDNFLESSGENILMGGAQATITPADIQISQNHFFKPLTWLKGQAGFVGGADGNAFIVKNLFELKNAQRVLLEGNIMEYSWGGFSQNGYAIVITPANQDTASGANVCPICQVTDVTIRYNTISHVGGGLQIANVLSDAGGAAQDGERYSIHDLTIDDINNVTYIGSGNVGEMDNVPPTAPLLQNVSINHLTAFAPRLMFSIGATVARPMVNINFTNSIFLAGTYPIWSTGGSTNCANADVPLTTFNACFSPYSFTKNAIIAAASQYSSSVWPSGNFFPATVNTVQFVNYNNGIGGNYQLLSTSPYHNAATDGTDLGADVATIVTETTGVY